MSKDFKRIPYGISNFKQVRRENKYLVDKTMFFEKMELAGNFLFLVRPRRFGKSLFLSMLEAYYDISEQDNFQELFKGLYVADHPTEYRNKYQVLPYAADPKLQSMLHGTQLHCIIVQIKGYDKIKDEEVKW